MNFFTSVQYSLLIVQYRHELPSHAWLPLKTAI